MDWLFGWITDWIKQGLIDAITGQFTGIFESVNNQVTDVASQVGQTPQGWNGGVFSMIQTLSETVVLPIAGMILTFVLVYELIQMILEKNNMHEFDTFNIFKWVFKTFVATYLLTNCFTIVMAGRIRCGADSGGEQCGDHQRKSGRGRVYDRPGNTA